ncbi:MAG: TonB-dependent receptor [Cyclobacteriaceae bacterium]|nr:TonB-dependent receptor [Cyclobacteriaceae bacterium]
MANLTRKYLLPLLLLTSLSTLEAQTIVSGTITDKITRELLVGANIAVKGSVRGTTSNTNGKYNLSIDLPTPFTLVFSFIGFRTEERVISENNTVIDLTMIEESLLGQEIVVSASRSEETIMMSPVTIEKMDILSIRQSATPDYFDALANLKGVQVTNSSITNTSVNTRGFSGAGNTRFVQLIDGIDAADPTIGWAVGSVMAPSELDIESLELIPGASSALYGPNAFNGIMLLQSKSPFEYPGLSMMVKQGATNSKAGGAHPMGTYSMRYAKSFKDKLAFKVNFHFMEATDWISTDYKTDRNNPDSEIDLRGTPNFDGLNLHGDETAIDLTEYGLGVIRRTGLPEGILLDNQEARILKYDAAIHYKLNEKMELIGAYRFGEGSALAQEDSKFAYRRYKTQFYKVELKSDNFFVRSYLTQTNAFKSYHVGAVGAFTNEYFNPSENGWVPDYINAFYNNVPGVAPNDPVAARSYADRFMIDPSTGKYVPSLQDTISKVRSNFFQRSPPGARFYSSSKMWHTELFYRFKQIEWAEVIAGGNYRLISVYSKGTFFDDAPNDPNISNPILTNTFGAYTQIAKSIVEKIKLTGSIRYDKMKDFDGHFTPRLSMVYSPSQNHNFRASYQTGFRFPELTSQVLFYNTAGGYALGGVPSIASRYGVYNEGAWTQASYDDFINQGGILDKTTGAILANPGNVTLETANVGYLKPERQRTIEIGYKGLLTRDVLIDFNYYYSTYNDFAGSDIVVSKNSTTHQGQPISAGTVWNLFSNASNTLSSYGIGLGITYNLPRNFAVNANYNYTVLSKVDEGFISGFNTPNNRISIGLENRKLFNDLGFNVNYRYQQSFLWQSFYGNGTIAAYGVLNAQVNYKLSSLKTILKIGGTNLGGKDYRTSFGSPYVGQMYYVSLVFDELLR